MALNYYHIESNLLNPFSFGCGCAMVVNHNTDDRQDKRLATWTESSVAETAITATIESVNNTY